MYLRTHFAFRALPHEQIALIIAKWDESDYDFLYDSDAKI